MRDYDVYDLENDDIYDDSVCDGDCENCNIAYECENSTVLDEF